LLIACNISLVKMDFVNSASISQQPLVSIVTPCFNAARFISQTIESVLGQDYPNIEYLIMDGGSTDGTMAVVEQYKGRLRWHSGPDSGTADAINRGFLESTGAILAWLNADDTYLPGAVTTAVQYFLTAPDAGVVYGEGVWVDENGAVLGRYPTRELPSPDLFQQECFICQPAAFLRRTAFEAAGKVDATLHSAFDYDLWIRLSRQWPFVPIPACLATSRMHTSNKSLGNRQQMFRESIQVLRKHYGYIPASWVYGYLSFLRDGRDQYFKPLRHSVTVYAGSLFAGVCYNWRHPWRYWREWASPIRFGNLRALWKDSDAKTVSK
jgi:glycosyltransferase involved in cell wall biosynthesis